MLTGSELGVLADALNRAGARAATSLRELLGEPAHAAPPEIWWVEAGEGLPESEYSRTTLEPVSTVLMRFEGAFDGSACLAVARNMIAELARAVLGGREAPADAALLEVGNILVNGFMGDVSNAVGGELTYTWPHCSTAPVRAALVRDVAGVVSHTCLAAPTLGVEASLYVALGADRLRELIRAT